MYKKIKANSVSSLCNFRATQFYYLNHYQFWYKQFVQYLIYVQWENLCVVEKFCAKEKENLTKIYNMKTRNHLRGRRFG